MLWLPGRERAAKADGNLANTVARRLARDASEFGHRTVSESSDCDAPGSTGVAAAAMPRARGADRSALAGCRAGGWSQSPSPGALDAAPPAGASRPAAGFGAARRSTDRWLQRRCGDLRRVRVRAIAQAWRH